MTHRHRWIVDFRGFARCKDCRETKQFPGYDLPKVKAGITSKMRQGEFGHDPGFWHCGTRHEI